MDEPRERHTYDHHSNNEESYAADYNDYQPRNTCPQTVGSTLIQGLEEVMEMSEESDITSSHQSIFNNE